MKAAIYTMYGAPSVLQLKDVEKPIPQPNEVLVKIKASSVTAGVTWVRKGIHPQSKIFTFFLRLMFGLRKPKRTILGYEFSGVVEALGENAKNYKIGDAVYGTTTLLPQGAYAEYICVPEKWKYGVIALKPANLSFEEAAALPIGSMTALQLLQKVAVKPQQTVLVYGASGSVGTYAIQLAKYMQGKVTGVCSTKNIALVKSLGADEVLDYTKTSLNNYSKRFDVVIDAVGKLPKATLKSLVKKGGKYISVNTFTDEKPEYLSFIEQTINEGKLKPVIDRVYPLEKIIEAHEYVDLGHKRGNVIIQIGN